MSGTNAHARTDPRFRVIDITPIRFVPDFEIQGSMGINDLKTVMLNYGAPSIGGSGVAEELLDASYAGGGDTAIANGDIHASDIAGALNESTGSARFLSLAGLLVL